MLLRTKMGPDADQWARVLLVERYPVAMSTTTATSASVHVCAVALRFGLPSNRQLASWNLQLASWNRQLASWTTWNVTYGKMSEKSKNPGLQQCRVGSSVWNGDAMSGP